MEVDWCFFYVVDTSNDWIEDCEVRNIMTSLELFFFHDHDHEKSREWCLWLRISHCHVRMNATQD